MRSFRSRTRGKRTVVYRSSPEPNESGLDNGQSKRLAILRWSSAAIVPDCLKSAVIKADKYEPKLNETYTDFANHYNTVILPARALHPKD
ncbi:MULTISPECIES: hypothetical protein [unclassified Saccharicrinis]|uniref:hypothetical protein n=1 Tax=unclassified Saccharicrinis TaxID=2646859 RepID=UPI003D34DB57